MGDTKFNLFEQVAQCELKFQIVIIL